MKTAKRITLFLLVNVLVIASISVMVSMLGLQPYLSGYGINYTQLALFCVIWGFAGLFISLALSRIMAKWAMGVKVIDPKNASQKEIWLVTKVQALSQKAGLPATPEVGIYASEEINAFATGPTRSRALVAVSSGLLEKMSSDEIEGVLGHEVAHIANGDMVTMTLIQGVLNAFVMFIARIIGFFVTQNVRDEIRPMVQMFVVIALDIVLSIFAAIAVAFFSRRREFSADQDGAALTGKAKMLSALKALKRTQDQSVIEDMPSVAALKISGRPGRFLQLFSTHPPLEMRIERLSFSNRT